MSAMSLDDGHNEQGCFAAGATPRAASASRRSTMEMFVAAMAAMRRARHSRSSSPSLRARSTAPWAALTANR